MPEYEFKLDGGRIAVWRKQTGEIVIQITCEESEAQVFEVEGNQDGPEIFVSLSDERLAEFRYWLKGQVVKLATEQKMPEHV